jgi:hypothetical protein
MDNLDLLMRRVRSWFTDDFEQIWARSDNEVVQ